MMVSSYRSTSSQRGQLPRKEKIIPIEQLGVAALPTITDTMEGVLEWLKSERLHKYWPVFSRMNYQTLIGLTEANMDYALNCIGSDPITNGARGRVLRCTERLRERSSQLNSIDEETSLDEIAEVFKTIATTPLSSTENELDGVRLIRLFFQKLNQVVGFHGPNLVKNGKLRKALQAYAKRPEVPTADKEHIEKILKNLLLVAKRGSSPKKSPRICSPASSPASSILSSSSLSPQRQCRNPAVFPVGPSALRPMCPPRSRHESTSTSPMSPAHIDNPFRTRCQSRGEKPSPPVSTSTDSPPGRQVPQSSGTKSPVGGRRPEVVTRKAEIPCSRSLFYKPPAQFFNSSAWPDPGLMDGFNSLTLTDDATFIARMATIEAALDLNDLWGGTTNQVMLDLNVVSSNLQRSIW